MRIAAAFVALAVAGPAFAQAPDLASAARENQRRAEATLARHRKERLADRATLAQRLQEAQARLAEAERAAQRAVSELEAARQRRAASAPLRARAAQRADGLTRLLGQAADLAPEARAPAETFIEGVDARVQARLRALERDTRIHLADGPVLGRDGRSQPGTIVRVGRIAALAYGESDVHTGFVREDEDRPPRIVGPVLGPEAISALRAAQPGRAGVLPLDVDGALTRVEAEPPTVASSRLQAGGIFVWPILAVGLLGLLLFAERFVYFVVRPASATKVRRVVDALGRGDRGAAGLLVDPPRTDLDRVLAAGIAAFDAPRPAREQALETALLREEPALERGVSLLGAVAGLAPLLGLLGTVTGMISTFDVISMFGTGNPRLLSSGISVALITTQLGLIVAVPALLAHAWVSRSVARRQALLEEARTALLSLEPASGKDPQ